MTDWKHIFVYGRPHSDDDQANGTSISQAIAEGHCANCRYLQSCANDDSFRPPVFAWCMKRKSEILAGWKGGAENALYFVSGKTCG